MGSKLRHSLSRFVVIAGFFCFLLNFPTVSAATTADLQQQLSALLQQVQNLQQQLQGTSQPQSSQQSLSLNFNLRRGLTDAKTNGEVSKLQQFLAQDKTIYPEGLVTGYFGPLTQKAMQRWQARNGIVSSGSPATTGYGVVGSKTRAKLQAVTFSSSTTPLTPTPLPPPSPSIIPIKLPIPTISSLQPTSGPIGTTVTITGSGFTPTGNKVKFGNLGNEYNPRYSFDSSDGKTLVFTVPSTNDYACRYTQPACFLAQVLTMPGTYAVSVINANGTSNEVSFTVNISPAVTSLSPTFGPIGTTVTIAGSGFTATGNKVKFGSLGSEDNPKYSLNSSDGKTLVFTVPSSNYLSCWYTNPVCSAAQYSTQPGIYGVSVINANGTSNEISFTVNISPAISSLSPTSGPIGTTVTITGSGFTPTGNKVKFGNSGSENNPSYSLNSPDGKTLVFTVPSTNYYACLYTQPVCYVVQVLISPGAYAVSVINGNGQSNEASFKVTASPV